MGLQEGAVMPATTPFLCPVLLACRGTCALTPHRPLETSKPLASLLSPPWQVLCVVFGKLLDTLQDPPHVCCPEALTACLSAPYLYQYSTLQVA